MASRFIVSVTLACVRAFVGVAGSCSSGTRDTSRKPAPHSLQCADCVGSSLWGGGADDVSVRLLGVCSCVAMTLGYFCVIFCAPDFLARFLGVVTSVFLQLGF